MARLFNDDDLWRLRAPGVDMIDIDEIHEEVKQRHIQEHKEKYYDELRKNRENQTEYISTEENTERTREREENPLENTEKTDATNTGRTTE